MIQFDIFVFDTQTFVFLPKTKIVRSCPPLEYTRKNQKWYAIPKTTPFLPLKWWLIPNLHQKTYLKWGYIPNIEYNTITNMSVSQRQILSAVHKQNNKTVRTTRTHNKVIHVSKHSKYNTFTKLSTLYINLST